MNFQLVLQFHGESLGSFSQLRNFEEQIREILGATETFDGLDVGGHGANLFIYTDDPSRTLDRIRPLLKQAGSEPGFTAACRTVGGERFRIIWPTNATAAFSLR